jgi:rhodanese-related sulfurtransferase
MTAPDTPTDAGPCDCWEVLPRDVPVLQDRFEDLLLLDCRTQAEYHDDHLRGAVLLPLQEISLRVGELDRWRERVVLAYCRTGNRSHIVAQYLAERGFRCVRSVAGGIEACRRGNHPC